MPGTAHRRDSRLRRNGGGLNLLETPRRIRQILLIARLDQVLLSFGTEEEAVRAFPVAAITPSCTVRVE